MSIHGDRSNETSSWGKLSPLNCQRWEGATNAILRRLLPQGPPQNPASRTVLLTHWKWLYLFGDWLRLLKTEDRQAFKQSFMKLCSNRTIQLDTFMLTVNSGPIEFAMSRRCFLCGPERKNWIYIRRSEISDQSWMRAFAKFRMLIQLLLRLMPHLGCWLRGAASNSRLRSRAEFSHFPRLLLKLRGKSNYQWTDEAIRIRMVWGNTTELSSMVALEKQKGTRLHRTPCLYNVQDGYSDLCSLARQA